MGFADPDGKREPVTSGGNVLVVLLCETRAWELTAESLTENVLDELGADLALCVGDHEQPNPLYEKAEYIWRLAEPDDWAEAYDRTAADGSWRVLLEVHEYWLGGIGDAHNPQVGSGAIGLYFREFLKESLERAGLTDAYDWVVVTRSDLLWPIPHPDVRHLSDRRIYVLDGEHYGGVSDRYIIVPCRFVTQFLSIPDPVFRDAENLKRRIDRRSAVQGWTFVNPERFLASRLKDLDLWRYVRYLPYVPITVRAPGGSARWSRGEFDDERGYFVKYPSERERSEATQRFIRDQEAWAQYLSPIRGLPMRRRLRKAYPKRGRWEQRAFPRVRGLHLRAYRWFRWSVQRHRGVLEAIVLRVGRQLRRIPGVRRLLDARVRRMQWRAERRRAANAERREAQEDAARDRDRVRLQELGAKGGLRINVGCGPGTLDGWVNVDLVHNWEGVLYLDVTDRWPLPDGCAAAINSEHFIEHIARDEARAYFAEAARVLEPGGVIRTSTPSLRGVIDAYLEANPEILAKYREGVEGWCGAENHAEMLNNTFFEWGHRHIYDFPTLRAMLEEAGF
jgi:predicted SAM-dependent methyltransferase